MQGIKSEKSEENLTVDNCLQLIVSFFLIFVTASTSTATTACSIVLRNNWRADALNLLVLFLDLLSVSLRVRIQPRLTILESIHYLFLLVVVHLFAEAFV